MLDLEAGREDELERARANAAVAAVPAGDRLGVVSLRAAVTSSTLVLAVAAVAALRFGHAFVRLRRRGRADHAGWDRAALFAAGLALAVAPLVTRRSPASRSPGTCSSTC